jgi:1-aminocyclopropane-1-carboxylate deaminase/D-cysteine desulfhydrase-like pyridoxal-dependent ACC family enzyme
MSQPSLDESKLIPGLGRHSRVALGHGPTAIDRLPALGRRLGITLSAKRDDCNGLAFGGNKVRQLEYYLGRAVDEGADSLLITGALQSNFVRLTAAAASRMGWRAEVQLEDRVPKDDVLYQSSGNVFLTRLLGAKIHHFAEGEDEKAADQNLEAIADRLRAEGRKPYVIHLGIDHPPYGGLGYVAAAAECWSQLQQEGEEVSHVVIPSGSGLTHAGFLVGARAVGWQLPVHGICVRRAAALQEARIRRRAGEIAALIDQEDAVKASDVLVHDRVLAPGYGLLNEATATAIRLAAETEALILDPVYSGRCMAGLIALVENGEIPQGAHVLFIHTGGHPAVFAYQNDLEAAL